MVRGRSDEETSRPDLLHDSLVAVEQPLAPDAKRRLDDITHRFRRGGALRWSRLRAIY
jgi:hypothetical protein